MTTDPILYWNDVAMEANKVSHTNKLDSGALGPTQSSRAFAIVHLAMYDAYAGVKGKPSLPSYLPGLPGASAGSNADAAVAGAAFKTLSALYPSQIAYFTSQLNAYELLLLTMGVSVADYNNGFAYGQTIGGLMLADRLADPNASDMSYSAPTARKFEHRPAPDSPKQGYHGPFYGKNSKCFSVKVRHALNAPPKPGDAAYTAALKQVRGKGIAPELMGTLPSGFSPRTIDETVVGLYWGYDGAALLGTPPRFYNQIVHKIAVEKGNTTEENARLFALVNAALGDAGILAWEQKYIHNFWRPVLGIREHDASLGPVPTAAPRPTPSDNLNNDCDSQWLPFGAPNSNGGGNNFTPPFPAYPSGHATFGAAAFQMVRLFYGLKPIVDDGSDNLLAGLSFVSEELNGDTTDGKGVVRPRHERKFTNGLWQMIEENGMSRIYLGVHWSFDAFSLNAGGTPDVRKDIGGVDLGLKIAEDIFNNARAAGLKKSTV